MSHSASQIQKRRNSRWLFKKSHREALAGYFFILPSYLGFVLFILIPMLAIFVLSFMEYSIVDIPRFIGIENFLKIFADPRTWTVYRNTFVFTLFAVIGNVGIGLMLAVLLNQKFPNKIRSLFRSAFFFPALVGLVYVSIIWQYLYQKDVGIINYYLSFFGIGKIAWLSSKSWVLVSAIILDVWKNLGMAMLILLSGLQGISSHYYEAAKVDGAGSWKTFVGITLPLLSPTLLFVITMNLTGALRVFESIVVLTKGGPGDSSRSIVMLIYEKAFQAYDFGYASAMSLTLLVVIAIVTLLHFLVSRWWVHYE
jgi:multiple sugar transport system permease protein